MQVHVVKVCFQRPKWNLQNSETLLELHLLDKPREASSLQIARGCSGRRCQSSFFSTTMHKLQNGFKINFGNTMITMLFEGQSDHLIPSTSQILVESDLFLMAGRMMGHSFIHGGPCLSGLSPAIIHVLLGNTSDTATIQLEDIPDLDLRETIKTVEGNNELTEREKDVITELALSWDLPGVTDTNRKWLFYRLLQHAVMSLYIILNK
ncbi:hypothetical protein DPEC_G00069710 [Dallia pectoralis]|uniref:Uncharacterized protein n=1 Tax=Dallia pectoralis TaxID=75939 RepID=A0ACC2H207_DALPE|nr:hypothetical protein DPEC_G00069710 [Dallia pectoralis]